MSRTFDIPDPMFNRLKVLAAQEGKSVSDLLIELVEKGLAAKSLVEAQQRFETQPIFSEEEKTTLPKNKLTNSDLFDIFYIDDDKRAHQLLERR